MQPHEVLLNVHIPFTQQHDYIREYKQAHRRDDDIAIANAGMRVRMAMGSEGGAAPSGSPHMTLQKLSLHEIFGLFGQRVLTHEP